MRELRAPSMTSPGTSQRIRGEAHRSGLIDFPGLVLFIKEINMGRQV
jgi:hypothetical protein